MSSSSFTSLKRLSPDDSKALSEEGPSFASWDEIEKLFEGTLHNENSKEDRSTVAREITKSLQSNIELKKDIDDLHCSLLELRSQRERDRESTVNLIEAHGNLMEDQIIEMKWTSFLKKLGLLEKIFTNS